MLSLAEDIKAEFGSQWPYPPSRYGDEPSNPPLAPDWSEERRGREFVLRVSRDVLEGAL